MKENKFEKFDETKVKDKKDQKNPKSKYPGKGNQSKFRKDKPKKDHPMLEKNVAGWNDLGWFAKYPEVLLNVSNFPLTAAAGVPVSYKTNTVVKIDGTGTVNSVPMDRAVAVPGIATFYYTPVIGTISRPNDPVNIAARKLFSTVTSGNSRSVSYNAAEMMKYIMVLTNLYAYQAYLFKIFGAMNTYTPLNRYYAKKLVEAMGVDFDDMLSHLNDLLAFANNFGVRINQWFLPRNISYTEREIWMNQFIYADAPTLRCQTYVFKPNAFLKYDNSVTPSQLVYETVGTALTFSALKTIGENLYAAMSNDDDINLICADLRKYYPAGDTWVAGAIDQTYSLIPIYNEEVLMEIENAAMVLDPTISTITEDSDGNLVQSITATYSAKCGLIADNKAVSIGCGVVLNDKLLNFHIPEVLASHFVIATRLTAVLIDGKVYTGSEILTSVKVWLIGENQDQAYTYNTGMGINKDNWNAVIAIDSFDWHPELIILTGAVDSGTAYDIRGILSHWDMSTVAKVENEKIRRLHEVCMQSLFKVE